MRRRDLFTARLPWGNAFEEWHLILYEAFSAGQFGQDVRDIIEEYPAASHIVVLAPYADILEVGGQVAQSTGPIRAGAAGPAIHILHYNNLRQAITIRPQSDLTGAKDLELSRDLQDAWLFDLFHRSRALVRAPEGVHFGKTSGKHSLYFLRGANCVMGSIECLLMGFFLLPLAAKFNPKVIYVDTGPLAAVADALARICVRIGVWQAHPSVQSFGSYEGLSVFASAHPDHLVVISASTSGRLEDEIIERTRAPERVGTLFYLQATGQPTGGGFKLADLTARDSLLTGYEPVETYVGVDQCRWCKEGMPYAEFEGDQFLLQQRKIEKINIAFSPNKPAASSFKSDAKEFFKLAKSKNVIATRLTSGGSHGYHDVLVDMPELIRSGPEAIQRFQEVISGWSIPVPIDLLVGECPEPSLIAALNPFRSSADPFRAVATYADLQTIRPVANGTSLVSLGLIESLHEPRKINEILRTITENGRAAYAAVLTMVDSPEAFRQLSSALRTGARGPTTFEFDSAYVLLFRRRTAFQSTWERERHWLQALVERLDVDGIPVEGELISRLSYLKNTGAAASRLFWRAQNGQELRLQSDFVFLPVDGRETQSDIYAVMSNLLSTAVQRNRDPRSLPEAAELRIAIRDSIYSEPLLDANNFLKYNDAILRAAMLRASNSSELNYSRDLEMSSTIASLVDHEISEWRFGRGQILSEFIVALGTNHLRLCEQHRADISRSIDRASSSLPVYVRQLASTTSY